MAWQLQKAKQKFSELVRRTVSEGPQTVSRHGEEVVVMLSIETYRLLTKETPDFKAYLSAAPDLDMLALARDERSARIVEL